MNKIFTFSIIILLFSLNSCSSFNSVLKGDDYAKKAVVANENYQKGISPKIKKNGKTKYKTGNLTRAIALYEQIYQKRQKTEEGEDAYFRIGKSYYLSKDYYMAGYYLGMFAQRYPYSPRAEESMFLSAMCSLENSPEWSLDQNETELAINGLQQFIDRYPNSILLDSCNHIIDNLRFKLEKKDYEAVKLYSKTENYQAAISAALTYFEDFPMSQFEEEVYFILVKNSYLLAKNSVEAKKMERIDQTIERYNNFVAKFPVSEYLKELEANNKVLLQYREELNSGK